MAVKNIGSIEFWLQDYRDTEFNESVDLIFKLYGEEDDEVLSIETFHDFCKRFAKAMGFVESTVDDWFGNY